MLRDYDFSCILGATIALYNGEDPNNKLPEVRDLLGKIKGDLEEDKSSERSSISLVTGLGFIFIPEIREYFARLHESYQLDFLDNPGIDQLNERYSPGKITSEVIKRVKSLEEKLEKSSELDVEELENLREEISAIVGAEDEMRSRLRESYRRLAA